MSSFWAGCMYTNLLQLLCECCWLVSKKSTLSSKRLIKHYINAVTLQSFKRLVRLGARWEMGRLGGVAGCDDLYRRHWRRNIEGDQSNDNTKEGFTRSSREALRSFTSSELANITMWVVNNTLDERDWGFWAAADEWWSDVRCRVPATGSPTQASETQNTPHHNQNTSHTR